MGVLWYNDALADGRPSRALGNAFLEADPPPPRAVAGDSARHFAGIPPPALYPTSGLGLNCGAQTVWGQLTPKGDGYGGVGGRPTLGFGFQVRRFLWAFGVYIGEYASMSNTTYSYMSS